MKTTFEFGKQLRIARDMWLTVTTLVGRDNLDFLFSHVYLTEMGRAFTTTLKIRHFNEGSPEETEKMLVSWGYC